ncbi:MAG: translesion DNA synthesis-associated protein ImuA [Burkholderiales bacterium]|nr:translesion DNA synthesis-associated protein ImuA [Burkholderiales bacterium]
MSSALDVLLEHPGLWRGGECARAAAAAAVPSGFALLDRCLPGGGWPQGALTEVFAPVQGIGEFALFLPACARLTRAGRWVAFIAPPHIPYAPALAQAGLDLARLLLIKTEALTDTCWALEQALKSRHCGAAFAWPRRIEDRTLRRLQLAAEQGGGSGFLFLPQAAAANASTAALRLALGAADTGELELRILKRRGGLLARPLRLDPRRPDASVAASDRGPRALAHFG